MLDKDTVLEPTGRALGLLLVSAILLGFSWIVVSMRMVVRMKIQSVGLDDYLMLSGLLCFTATCIATIAGSLQGVGSPPSMITLYYDQQGRMWFMLFQLFYVASTVPIKASICVALLRITPRRAFRLVLHAVIGLTVIAAVVCDVTVLAWCRPVAATWTRGLGVCGDPSVITSVSYYLSATSILTDWTCAILPAVILWDVQMRWKIKASVAVVLGFGFIASAATLVRFRYILAYTNPEAYLLGIANIATWSVIESGLGLIAGSLATLRPLLRYMSFFGSSGSATPAEGGGGGGGRLSAGWTKGAGRRSHMLQPLAYGMATHHTVCEGGAAVAGGGKKGKQHKTKGSLGEPRWERLSDEEEGRGGKGMPEHVRLGAAKGITVTTAVTTAVD